MLTLSLRELDPDRCFWKWKPEERTFSVAASSSSFSTLPSFEPSSSSSSSSVPLSASSPPSTGGRFSVSSLPILAKLIQEQQLPSPSPPPRKVTPRNEGKGGEEENKEGEEEGKEREGEGEGEGKGEGEGEGEENPEKLDADHFMSIIPKITKNQEGKKGVCVIIVVVVVIVIVIVMIMRMISDSISFINSPSHPSTFSLSLSRMVLFHLSKKDYLWRCVRMSLGRYPI